MSVGTFISLFTNKQILAEEEELELISPIIDHWIKCLDNMDEGVHENFKNDLHEFSDGYPNWFDDGTSMIDVYNNEIWIPLFNEEEIKMKFYTNKIESAVGKFNSKYMTLIKTNFTTISPFDMEEVVCDLFIAKGFNCYTTRKTGDFGVDVIAKNGVDTIAIQVKKYSLKNKIRNIEVQQLLGGMTYREYKANRAIFVTTSYYTSKAIEQAEENPIELWDRDRLINEIKNNLC
jgi:restriction system protein